jgi:UDP-N-acetylenolpyruvoylglucosamine reductase
MFEEYKDITSLTTFGIPVKTRYFAEYTSEKELLRISRSPEFINNEVLHIGGGSNLLFTEDFNGVILHSGIKGIKRYDKDADTTFVIAGAGERWIDFVDWCIDNNLAGVENMANIPGEVGASPVQNVGAYGVEACDVIHSVECFDMQTRTTRRFTNEECHFAYRDSFFKNEGKGRYIVLRVSFRLKPDGVARHLEYGPLATLKDTLGRTPTIREVADEVTRIRDSKLPKPEEIGSAGSFFKNPVVSAPLHREMMRVSGEEIPGHKLPNNRVKLSAAWLIDHAGMKGQRVGGAVCFQKQPLVIANDRNASARDVVTLCDQIREAVREKYLIDLCPEVNFISTSINITVLGSGTSKGVPEIGCRCRVCRSPFEKDKRTRASVFLQTHGLNILIDPSPDFRQQALRENISHIDAVLITHNHYDHVGGMDDLRPFCAVDNLPIYLRADVNDDLHRRLDYCFVEHLYPGVPTFDMKVVGDTPFYIKGVKVEPVEVLHGKKPIIGFRIGKFAYITDAKSIEEKEKRKLENLDILILNALRDQPHFAHFSLAESLQLIEELQPKESYLTHFNHEIGFHHDLELRLPEHVHPCYDGLKLTIF